MPDEPREYDIAINMLKDGDWVVPHLAGDAFLQKPPLAYWLQSASLHALGASEAAARLPSLLWAMLAAFVRGDAGTRSRA
jgi:4-amino-4-deoxy-L-arabinose transferase-like glycosyltransferase